MKKYSLLVIMFLFLVIIACFAVMRGKDTSNARSLSVTEDINDSTSSNIVDEVQIDEIEFQDMNESANSDIDNYTQALEAFKKEGFYFKDEVKPKRIISLASRVDIIDFPKDIGIFGKFSRLFEFEGLERNTNSVDLVFVNTLNKNFEEVFKVIVSNLDNRNIVTEDDPSAFIGFVNELHIKGGRVIKNNRNSYKDGRLDTYMEYEVFFIGYDWDTKDITYILKYEP